MRHQKNKTTEELKKITTDNENIIYMPISLHPSPTRGGKESEVNSVKATSKLKQKMKSQTNVCYAAHVSFLTRQNILTPKQHSQKI